MDGVAEYPLGWDTHLRSLRGWTPSSAIWWRAVLDIAQAPGLSYPQTAHWSRNPASGVTCHRAPGAVPAWGWVRSWAQWVQTSYRDRVLALLEQTVRLR